MKYKKAPIEEHSPQLLRFKPTTFPLRPHEKIPAVKWKHLEPGEEVTGNKGTTSWGLATGYRSGGLVVIDVDCKGEVNGYDTLADLEEKHPLPETFTVETPSGGAHLYFWHPDPVRTTAGKGDSPFAGIDTRAEGGLVVLAGSEINDRFYTVSDDSAVARLPDEWYAILPKYQESAVLEGDLKTERMENLEENLRAVVRGKKHPVWKAWRNVADGKAPFTHEQAHKHGGGVEVFLRNHMMVWLSRESEAWAAVPGEQMADFMIGSMMNLTRGNGNPEVSKYADVELLATKWDTARLDAQGRLQERAPVDPNELSGFMDACVGKKREKEGLAPLPIGLPRVLCTADAKETYFLTEEGYEGPFSGSTVMSIGSNRYGILNTYVDAEGKQKKMGWQQYFETYNEDGHFIDKIFLRADTTKGVYDPKTSALALPIGRKALPPEPKFSDSYDKVLKALGGDLYEELVGWIRYAKTDCLGSASVGLVLVGASAIGKSLLANAIAMANGMSAAGGKNAFERFNYSAITNCLVFLDEEMPRDHRGNVQTEKLKEMIMATSHSVEQKGEKLKILNHSVRVMMAANSLDTIFKVGSKSRGDKEGMARRFLVIPCEEGSERAVECKNILRSMHADDPHQFSKVAQEAAAHVAWIYENVEPKAPKARSEALANYLKVGGRHLETILEVLQEKYETDKKHAVQGAKVGSLARVKGPHLCFKLTELLDTINDTCNMRFDIPRLKAELEPLGLTQKPVRWSPAVVEKVFVVETGRLLESKPDFFESDEQ